MVGIFAVTAGYTYAVWANKRWVIPIRNTNEMPEVISDDSDSQKNLPPLWLSLAPIILPVILIAGQTLAKVNEIDIPALRILGDKNIALIISAIISLIMLAWVKRKPLREMAEPVQDAISRSQRSLLVPCRRGPSHWRPSDRSQLDGTHCLQRSRSWWERHRAPSRSVCVPVDRWATRNGSR